MTLDNVLSALLGETPDVQIRDGREFARNGAIFAARPSADTVELRLGEEIGEAALRTPGTSPSPRGPEWVSIRSDDWSSARDRLEAWYRVAWRLAGKPRG